MAYAPHPSAWIKFKSLRLRSSTAAGESGEETGPESSSQTPKLLLLLAGETLAGEASSVDSVAALVETSSMIPDFPRTETGPESSSQTPKLLLLAGETLAGEASSVDSVAALAETSSMI